MNVCVPFRASSRVPSFKIVCPSSCQGNSFSPYLSPQGKIGAVEELCCTFADRRLEILAMISLYRGELHKVSGVPRQWTVPKSTIPVSVFVKALKKRNAALLRELKSSSSPEKFLLPSYVTPVSAGESLKLTSSRITKELVLGETIASGTGCGTVGVEENKNTTFSWKWAESSERIEEDSDICQEKKKKKQEDFREESYTKVLGGDTAHRGAEKEEKTSKLQDKESARGLLESMALDAVDQSEEMECDILAVEKTGSECAEGMAEDDRVRVNETGTRAQVEMDIGRQAGSNDSNHEKVENVLDSTRNWEQTSPQARRNNMHPILGSASAINVSCSPQAFSKDAECVVDVVDEKMSEKTARKRKREELQTKLQKLTADKHHLVLMLKQVLNEEESKKRVSSANAPQLAGAGLTGAFDVAVAAGHKHAGLHPSGDLEEGELEYARTPSPPPRSIQNNHSNLNSHNVLGPPPPIVPILGRQNTLTQHISQGSSGRGGYFVPGSGIPPPPVGPGIGGVGPLSPGAVYMGNLPSSLGPHNYSHNLALQHAAAMHAAQKIVPVPPVHGQFNSIPPSGAPLGAGPGVAGGPPGFGGYVVPPPLHPHHSHLSQTAASSTSHIPVQQGVVTSSLLTTPRGPVGFHDMRLGGNTWIPR